MEEVDRINNESYEDYDKRIRRVYDKKNMKYTSSYTTRDIFYYIQHNRKKLGITLELFSHIVKTLNEKVVEIICKGGTVDLPAGMGNLFIRKNEAKIILLPNGKYSSTACVDWKATKKLWYEDPEAERDRIVVYFNRINEPVFRFSYSRKGCKVHNLKYYVFRPHRRVKIKMKDINKNDIIFKHYDKLHKHSTGYGRCS